MWRKVKINFERGIEKIKWFSAIFAERTRIELLVIKLLYQSNKMEKHKDELMKTIGKRIIELKGQPEKYILKDRTINEALNEIEQLNKEIDEIRKKASDISSL
ncbi:MAG: hypothetical protein HXY52_05610 [Nitrospirae bacterium]|jgi:ArsR family metal-binding transcriptional regulator|nr:hypothetical protein [Nitrospirota bacterium]